MGNLTHVRYSGKALGWQLGGAACANRRYCERTKKRLRRTPVWILFAPAAIVDWTSGDSVPDRTNWIGQRHEGAMPGEPGSRGEFDAESFSQRLGGAFQGLQRHGIVFWVKQTVERRTAGVHPPSHFRFGNVLLFDQLRNLKSDDTLDRDRFDICQQPFLCQEVVEVAAQVRILLLWFHCLCPLIPASRFFVDRFAWQENYLDSESTAIRFLRTASR